MSRQIDDSDESILFAPGMGGAGAKGNSPAHGQGPSSAPGNVQGMNAGGAAGGTQGSHIRYP